MKTDFGKELIFEGKDKLVQEDWNIYWSGQDKTSGKIYDKFAEFYRDNIIKPALNHFIFKHIPPSGSILHAGCGSGQVDTDIVNSYKVTALDISYNALKIYESVNPQKARLVQASIFATPFENNAFDGIYNLGVMEHFTEEEINLILVEFKRILKPGSKIVLFIPPVFGLTVRVLDTAHYILNNLLKKNIKLHPDEITRVKSQEHIQKLVENAGFHFLEYYFGIKDFYTQSVIVAIKK